MHVLKQMKFNLNEAIEFAKLGFIEEWIHIFLKTVGDNVDLSDGLKNQRRHWVGPLLMPIEVFDRCCGPEEHMEYFNHPNHWEPHIDSFVKLIQEGWEYPPLIIEHENGKLTVRDGNHRHEALRRAGLKECWVVIWDSESSDNLEVFKNKNATAPD